jgi:hypothetical protein
MKRYNPAMIYKCAFDGVDETETNTLTFNINGVEVDLTPAMLQSVDGDYVSFDDYNKLRAALQRLADCDFTISLPDRMDAVRKIAREALNDRG